MYKYKNVCVVEEEEKKNGFIITMVKDVISYFKRRIMYSIIENRLMMKKGINV